MLLLDILSIGRRVPYGEWACEDRYENRSDRNRRSSGRPSASLSAASPSPLVWLRSPLPDGCLSGPSTSGSLQADYFSLPPSASPRIGTSIGVGGAGGSSWKSCRRRTGG